MLLNEIVNSKNPNVPDTFSIDYKGTEVFLSMAPYMWMYPMKGEKDVSVQVALKKGAANVESEFIRWDSAYLELTKAEVIKHVKEFLDNDGLATLEKKTKDWASMTAKFNKSIETEKNKEKTQDDEHKAQGHTHKVIAVIHHQSSGSDTPIVWYSKGKPSKDDVQTSLKKQKSIDLSDYKIVEL